MTSQDPNDKGSGGQTPLEALAPTGAVTQAPYDQPTKQSHNLAKAREEKRGQLAMTLVWLLLLLCLSPVVVILSRGLCVWAATENEVVKGACEGFPQLDLAELLKFLITPIVGLVGAATGFYFGEKAPDKAEKG